MLPPNVGQDVFDRAIAEFRQALGDEWVYTEEADVALYRDAYSPFYGEAEDRVASAAVAPASTEEVQEVVRIANRHAIPIYPISTGKNLGYGGSAPNLSGSVVVDLARMNTILAVDDVRHFALVEPGVSYFDLYNHIEEHNLDVWIDCPDPGWGSLVGNALDHGVGYTGSNYRNHFDAHCGLEVVLPDGSLMRTGMGALPDTDTWQDFKMGYGPMTAGLFGQGNYGIVTKMGFWLMSKPKGFFVGRVSMKRFGDMIPLVRTLNYLENSGIISGIPWFSSPALGGYDTAEDREVLHMVAESIDGDYAQLDGHLLSGDKPCWTLELMFYGPQEIVTAQWEFAKRMFRDAVGDAVFEEPGMQPLAPVENPPAEGRLVNYGIPNLEVFYLGARSEAFPRPSDGHMWLSPVIPRTGEALLHSQAVWARFTLDNDYYMGSNVMIPMAFAPRSFMFIIPVFLAKDPQVNRRGRQILRKAIEVCTANGWSEYRTPPAFQDLVMEQQSFGDHAHRRFCERIKDAIDPKGIIAAGRYGIWPEHMRGEPVNG